MTNAASTAFDYSEERIVESKRASHRRRYNATNFRIPFRINRIVMLTVLTWMLLCRFVGSVAGRQASSSHGREYYDRRCSGLSQRRSMVYNQTSRGVAADRALEPQDVISRLEAAAVLRDNLVTTLGRVLTLCLDDDAIVPFERVHGAVRDRRVAVYELLRIAPVMRNKLPRQQLYKILQMLERVDNRFVSEYASLCINAYVDVDGAMESAPFDDMLRDVDESVIESISRDKHRPAVADPLSLTRDVDFLLRAARDGNRILNLHTVSAILLNYPAFDLTDPEVHGAIGFVARRMRERARSDDPLLRYMGTSLEDPMDFLRTVLERLEVDEESSVTTREAVSSLLENFGAESYPSVPNWKGNAKKLLTIANDHYPPDIAAVAKYLADRLDDAHLRDLDIGFYETGDRALLQMLSRLRGKSELRHLWKPLSLLTPFVSQKVMNDADYDYTAPITFREVNDYLDSFETPCLPRNVSDAMKTLRPHLSEDLPWTYAFGDRRASDDPWELTLSSLIRLRSVPMNKRKMNVIDNFIYKSRTSGLTGRRGALYDSGVVFQRDDSTDVEIDLYSLLMRIPNAFKSEKFAPMLNFLSKPNILGILGYEFNKFEHETPRSLLLAMLKRALALSPVKSDESLSGALENAHNYLVEPLLVNLYTSEDLQLLLKYLPGIDSDPRYLPLKILFKKQKLFAYLSSTFNLAGLRAPIERLSLILQTVGLKVGQSKLSESLSFALDNINGPPLPVKTLDRADFNYLVQQLLSRNKKLRDDTLVSYAYANVSDWNISISGTPENVLARVLSHPIDLISSDMNLAELVKQAENILEEGDLIDIEMLRARTLEAILEYLPSNTYVKPVNLLLRKANLMALVPKLNLTMLEGADARDALIALLKSLTESRVIRAEKLLLRRVRAALSSLDSGASENENRQTPIFVYLIQSLQDPSNVVYEPLLREIRELRNATVTHEEREVWLKNYLRRIVAANGTDGLTRAASTALKEIAYDENTDEVTRASKARIGEAVSFLPTDTFAEPLRKLLTPDWAYDSLPDELRDSDSLEKEELLLAILYHAKRRADVSGNVALTAVVSKVETSLNGWRTNVEPLKNAAAVVKAAVYDPTRSLLTAGGLNKIKVTVPYGGSAKVSLLGLLHRLLIHPVIKRNNEVWKMLSVVRQDVLALGIDADVLTVLDDAEIPYVRELAPIRLFLHRRDVNDEYARTVLSVADPGERYRTLLDVLRKQRQTDNDTRFLDALSTLSNIRPGSGDHATTLISDLDDVVNAIPHRVRQRFKSIEHLFDADVLSRLTRDNEIVRSATPLTALLSRIARLPEVSNNRTAASELNKLRSSVAHVSGHPITTGFQIRPLLLELGHVQQINLDYLDSILDPEILSYLNSEEFSEMPNDRINILRIIVDYLLDEGPAYVDYNMLKHLQSLKRALALTTGSDETSRRHLTKEDWEKMLVLIPHEKDYAPVKIFLRSNEIAKYIPKDVNWQTFPTPVRKLLHLLSLVDNDEIENENVRESASKLRDYLEKRFNFVTEKDIRGMQRTLASLRLKYDLVSLKIFLNHDNVNKYLPPDFRYTKYNAPIDAFAAALDYLLRSSNLRRRVTLYESMVLVKRALNERTSSAKRSSRRSLVRESLPSEDLEFVRSLNTSLPKLREFLRPEKLAGLLPKTFTVHGRPTYKTKMLHLLRELLRLNTDVDAELDALLREVAAYPDVPNITRDDLAPLLSILPVEGIPHVALVKEYLRPTTLMKLLPGNFDIKRTFNARVTLHDVLLLVSVTLGSAGNDKLKIALDALVNELAKIDSNVIPAESIVDSNDVRSIVKEIPFDDFKQIEPLKAQMTTARVVSSLPLNFQLTGYKTKKLRVLAVLDELSKSDGFRASLNSIEFAKRIVGKMPDTPTVNDTEIERLLLPLPLNTFYVKLLVTNCKLANLTPYLPIHFNLSGIESRKTRIAKILHYCKVASPNVSTRQALTNAEALLRTSPDFDVTPEHVDALIGTIPCTHFTSIKPLLRFLAKTDVASLLPWDLDLYQTPRNFKTRVFDLLTALRNVKELQNDEMFSALDSLETNAKSLPEQVNVPQDRVDALKRLDVASAAPCANYRDFVSKTENLIQILPPNYRFRANTATVYDEWSSIMRFSELFLRDVKKDGATRDAFEACADNIRKFHKENIYKYMLEGLNHVAFEQLVPLRLYTLGHADTLTAPVEDTYRRFSHGSLLTPMRVFLMEFIRRPELTRSKALLNDMEVYLHDYLKVTRKAIDKEWYREEPSPYEIDRAIGEIPSDREYDNLRLLTRCRDIQGPIAESALSADDTPKRLLLRMLELAEKGDIDEEIRQSVERLKPSLVVGIREEEVEYALKQMRDYRYHAGKVEVIRRYLVKYGLQYVIGSTDDFHTKYPTYKDRLVAINDVMLNVTMNRTDLSPDYRAASDHLNRTLHNEIKIEHIVPRTMDDINVRSLFFALPRTRDEGIIRGIIRFFSIPDLLRKLNLPRDPFEYATKGRLLRAIMDLGQELESVQRDPVQQEALEYFRDKIIVTGPGAQPIELKKYARDSNVDVDTYGVMRAIDYERIDETDAVNVAMFFERRYDNLVHAVGFDHMAYATRGAYLKALFEHLLNVSQVPDDVKERITLLLPAVRLDGPGDESVDLNVDVVHEEEAPSARMFGELPANVPYEAKPRRSLARYETEMPEDFRENEKSLKTAVDNMLETISSSEEEYLERVNGQSSDVYRDKTRIVIGSPQHPHDIARRKLNSEGARTRGGVMDDFELSLGKVRGSKVPSKVSTAASDLTKGTKRTKNHRPTVESSLDDVDVPRNKVRLTYKIVRKAKRAESTSDLSTRTKSDGLDYLSGEDDGSSVTFEKGKKVREKSYREPHRAQREMIPRFLIQPDTSIDIEYDDFDEDAPIVRILSDMLQKNEDNLSLTEQLMALQTKRTGEKTRTVKKDLSSGHMKKKRNVKDSSR